MIKNLALVQNRTFTRPVNV